MTSDLDEIIPISYICLRVMKASSMKIISFLAGLFLLIYVELGSSYIKVWSDLKSAFIRLHISAMHLLIIIFIKRA